jgi:hypothetical protein
VERLKDLGLWVVLVLTILGLLVGIGVGLDALLRWVYGASQAEGVRAMAVLAPRW